MLMTAWQAASELKVLQHRIAKPLMLMTVCSASVFRK